MFIISNNTFFKSFQNNLEYDYDCYIGTNLNGQIQLSGGYSQAILSELQNIFGFKYV